MTRRNHEGGSQARDAASRTINAAGERACQPPVLSFGTRRAIIDYNMEGYVYYE
jgi:hypothetical protein